MKRQIITNCLLVVLLSVLAMTGDARANTPDWPLWDNYWSYFASTEGRIYDHDLNDRTTSEAQAYAMFFALVANDRERFAKLLHWTEQNLASGDLRHNLPAWTWGLGTDGKWKVLDYNSASDADLWIAYSLIQAGHLWNDRNYRSLGQAVAERIATEEVADLPGFGLMLLPGKAGYRHGSITELNPSYVPLQLLYGLAGELPHGPWRGIASNVPRLIEASSQKGFVMDWVAYDPGKGFTPSNGPRSLPMGAWDAIRVYLWAGMLDRKSPQRLRTLQAIGGMDYYLHSTAVPPMKVNEHGSIVDRDGSIGFSAALIPYLLARGSKHQARIQRKRIEAAFNSATGLYGNPPRYYDDDLAIFYFGWAERRFWFSSSGLLKVKWTQ